MNITLIQADLVWNDPAANRNRFEREIFAVGETDLVVLPEMFPTGFCTRPREAAEPDGGPTLAWMRRTARKKGAALAGSVAVEQDGRYFNRFYFVRPDGATVHYDKRHLFTYGGEHKEYTGGDRRVIAEYKGWRILLQVCYDLRFPVWSRNRDDYDMILYVASWPTPRVEAWSALLKARAIENVCYVAGVNRVGDDPNCIFNPPVESFILKTDSQRLSQVLINLLTNASKFTEKGTIALAFEIQKEQRRILFSVSDTGCGIPRERQERVFNRFEKLNEFKQGTGLGLAICKQIVLRFGGNIWIDPEYTEGARFVFSHPIVP